MNAWCVVPAGGAGRRMGAAEPKQFLELGGRPVLVWTLESLAGWGRWSGMVVAAPADRVERVRGMVQGAGLGGLVSVVPGGAERRDSVRNGLEAVTARGGGPDDLVFVHDGVRPFPPVDRFDELAEAARPDGALLAVPCQDTLKRAERGAVAATVDRTDLWRAQTPQVFPLGLLERALEQAARSGAAVTDEASAVEALGRRPRIVTGDGRNLKVTVPGDLEEARALAGLGRGWAVGHGFDVHRFVAGRPLVLGGVEVPHDRGLLGHSDADVLAHAVCDACLGAAGLGDLGRHFPDTDPRWAGASSMDLLGRVASLVRGRGWNVVRVDATLVAQRPKVAPHVPGMERNLSAALGLGPGGVTVKATTTEGLGFEGREEGVSAHAVALIATLSPPSGASRPAGG